jgi:hypothetical protein
VALASRADPKFAFLPLQAGSDDVVPKSASWKARFWIEAYNGHPPTGDKFTTLLNTETREMDLDHKIRYAFGVMVSSMKETPNGVR